MSQVYNCLLRECDHFEGCIDGPARNDVGLCQFHAFESQGIRPEQPDAYFTRLVDGKRWWEWQLNEMAGMYGTSEWWGWAALVADGWDRSGLIQLFNRIGRRAGHGDVYPFDEFLKGA